MEDRTGSVAAGDSGLRRAGDTAWRLLGIIALVAVILWGLYLVRAIALPILLGVVITTLLLPPYRWLGRRGLSRALATVVVCLGGFLLLAAFVALLVPSTVNGVAELGRSFGKVAGDLQSLASSFGLSEQRSSELFDQAKQYLSTQGGRIASGALAGVHTVGEILIGLVLAMILSVYFVHSGDRLVQWITDLAPRGTGPTLRDSGKVIFDVIGRYIRGVAIVGLVDGFFIGIALWILGVPIALPLAVLTFAGAFLPVVGAFTAGLLAAVVAFVAKGWLVALIVVAVTVLIQQLEGHVLAPQIYGRALDLPSAVILISIALGGVLGGIVGTFLAAPVTSVVVALIRHRREDAGPPPAKT
ncbi:Predicted PurR-regulated permease PerM [Streptosporangium subroseum]|uniref:Predicted PurR-regulated permease PerM n=1 Tax=Streptosporangium subroseum TaxID=106412 RepID=A0A239BEJ6_9ACTN|nr:AI-2E family transporter [Streptosporangium subroseum]SNS05504.1 Predicted PurR-regulated permease PerM [Streptosporangium subroseum]